MKKGYWTHTARANERWDIIAYDFYGDAGMISVLITANPHIDISVYIPEGTKVYVPVLEEKASDDITDSLPPWQR